MKFHLSQTSWWNFFWALYVWSTKHPFCHIAHVNFNTLPVLRADLYFSFIFRLYSISVILLNTTTSHCSLVLSLTLPTEAAEDWKESVSTEISNADIGSNKLITMLDDISWNQDIHQEYFCYSSFSVVLIALYHPINQSLTIIVHSLVSVHSTDWNWMS